MKRPHLGPLRRSRMVAGRIARTAQEAAIDLVRTEFDLERLRRGIQQSRIKTAAFEAELEHAAAHRNRLLALIRR